jgi:DNA-binding transcriptional regulator YdaS (Cro superfamily)
MDFKTFFSGLSARKREELARAGDTSVGHLRNIAYGQKPCGEKLAVVIDRESNGVVPCESLRPDVDWAYLRGTNATVSAEICPNLEKAA